MQRTALVLLMATAVVPGPAVFTAARQAAGAAAASVLAPGATVEKIAGDFIFTEGPASDPEGNLYFVDQDNNRIVKYDTAGTLTTFMQPSVMPTA
jgi:sugar lactone lactonase YvrE